MTARVPGTYEILGESRGCRAHAISAIPLWAALGPAWAGHDQLELGESVQGTTKPLTCDGIIGLPYLLDANETTSVCTRENRGLAILCTFRTHVTRCVRDRRS